MRFSYPALVIFIGLLLLSTGFAKQTADDRDAPILESTKPIKRKIAGGEYHYYRIMLMADQYVRLAAEYYEVKLLEERVATFQDKSRLAPQSIFRQAEQLREQAHLSKPLQLPRDPRWLSVSGNRGKYPLPGATALVSCSQ